MATYTLSTDNETDARIAMDGWRYKVVLQNLDERLRSRVKYEDLPEIECVKVREWITDLCDEGGVRIYD